MRLTIGVDSDDAGNLMVPAEVNGIRYYELGCYTDVPTVGTLWIVPRRLELVDLKQCTHEVATILREVLRKCADKLIDTDTLLQCCKVAQGVHVDNLGELLNE